MTPSTTRTILLAMAFSSIPDCLATNGKAQTRSLESDPDAFCYSFGTDCRSCLREGCSFDGSQCIPDCSHAPADGSCYRLGTWPGVGLLDTCRKAKNAHLEPWTDPSTWEASSSFKSPHDATFATQESFESSQGFSTGKATNDNTEHWTGTTGQEKRMSNPTAAINSQEAFEISQGFSSGKVQKSFPPKESMPNPHNGISKQEAFELSQGFGSGNAQKSLPPKESMSNPHDGISKQEAFEISQGFKSAKPKNSHTEPWTTSSAIGQQGRTTNLQDGISTQEAFLLSQGFGESNRAQMAHPADAVKAQEAFEQSQGFGSQNDPKDVTSTPERFVINIEIPPPQEQTKGLQNDNNERSNDEAADSTAGDQLPQGSIRGASPDKKRKSILNFLLP